MEMPRRGFGTVVTGVPAACRPATTAFHDELSAKAPCTRTTVGPVGATMLASDTGNLRKDPRERTTNGRDASRGHPAVAPVTPTGQTRISPSSDQSSCGTVKLTI